MGPAADVAELFERAQVSDLGYAELAAARRDAEALARWPVLNATLQLLRPSSAEAPSSDAAELFGSEGRRR